MTVCTSQTIRVERALYGSSNRGSIQGYQLLNWSPGIDSYTAKELAQWAPTRLQSIQPDDWTVQAFPLHGDRVCIGRTFVSGYEYSQRGSPNIVSSFVILDARQWEAYEYDALAVFYVAMALGYMRLAPEIPYGPCQCVELPAFIPITSEFYLRPKVEDEQLELFTGEQLLQQSTADRQELAQQSGSRPSGATNVQTGFIRQAGPTRMESALPPMSQIAQQLNLGQRIGLVGIADPFAYVAQVIEQLSFQTRKNLSFTTGLPLSVYRPFQLHFIDAESYHRQHTLVSTLADAIYGT